MNFWPQHQDGRTTTCTAGGGSLLLEFSILSRLLGDPIYEMYAGRAVAGLYSRRWDRERLNWKFTFDCQTWGDWSYNLNNHTKAVCGYALVHNVQVSAIKLVFSWISESERVILISRTRVWRTDRKASSYQRLSRSEGSTCERVREYMYKCFGRGSNIELARQQLPLHHRGTHSSDLEQVHKFFIPLSW